ncbi:MAG: DUF4382 domain-containing protein [Planctomycetota bacterium]|jgi:hypothetical protein
MNFTMNKRIFGLLLAINLTVFGLIGCAGNSPPADEPQTGTGSLKMYVTDKPFPVDLLEEAIVKVVRIDVRRAGPDDDGDMTACMDDSDCDDGVACNGEETCRDATCAAGVPPECPDNQVCDEVRDVCAAPCTVDTDCADDLFCNGDEVCDEVTGLCFAGEPVDCEDGETCDEDGDACAGDTSDDNGNDDDGDGSPFITVFEGERYLNLLDLQNGRTDLLADAMVPAGTYTQVRVYVEEGSVQVVDIEDPFVMKVPSGAQSGIKLNFTFEVNDSETTELLLDVDLSRAFKVIPGGRINTPEEIREFKFQPSLAMRLINLLDAGSIAGTLTSGDANPVPVAGAMVTAYDDEDKEVTSTSSEDDGSFVLSGLPTGSYRVVVDANGFLPLELTDVAVTAGESTDVGEVSLTPES